MKSKRRSTIKAWESEIEKGEKELNSKKEEIKNAKIKSVYEFKKQKIK